MSIDVSIPLTVETVERLERRRIEALLSADGDALAELQHTNGVVVHSSGFVDAMGSYAAGLSARSFVYYSLAVIDRRIEIIGDLAISVYRQDAEMLVLGEPQRTVNRCTAVWSVDHGEVKLSLVQSTRLAA